MQQPITHDSLARYQHLHSTLFRCFHCRRRLEDSPIYGSQRADAHVFAWVT